MLKDSVVCPSYLNLFVILDQEIEETTFVLTIAFLHYKFSFPSLYFVKFCYILLLHL